MHTIHLPAKGNRINTQIISGGGCDSLGARDCGGLRMWIDDLIHHQNP